MQRRGPGVSRQNSGRSPFARGGHRFAPTVVRRRSFFLAFTLVELLVVISVIVVLAGLLFPVMGGVQERAKRLQAATDEQTIVNAVKNYATEYGKYPLPASADGGSTGAPRDVICGPTTTSGGGADFSNDRLFNVLRGLPTNDQGQAGGTAHLLNPRQVVFLETRDARDPAAPRAGVSTAANTRGQWMDPWGMAYVVFVDGDYDNVINQARFTGVYRASTADHAPAPATAVAAASFGKDRVAGTKTRSSGGGGSAGGNGDGDYAKPGCDDVLSWR